MPLCLQTVVPGQRSLDPGALSSISVIKGRNGGCVLRLRALIYGKGP